MLLDWRDAGLNRPSAFRSYIVTLDQTEATPVGRLSERDWEGVQSSLALALGAGESEVE